MFSTGAEVQIGGHGLGDDSDDLADLARGTHDVMALDARVAGSRRNERRQHADERGFAGAVRPEETENFAVTYIETQTVDGAEIAESLGQFIDFDGKGGNGRVSG